MRPLAACVLMLSSTALLAGCAQPPAAALDAAFRQGATDAVAERYHVEALEEAVAIDGDVDLTQREMNVLTGKTSPFDLAGGDDKAGDGLARSWVHRFVARDLASGERGWLTLQTFQDGSTPRERFEPFAAEMAEEDKQEIACLTPATTVPAIDSRQAAATAAEQPGLKAFAATHAGQYVYTYDPPLQATEACKEVREASEEGGEDERENVWTIEYLDLAASRLEERLFYVPQSYAVAVDAVTGAIVRSQSVDAHGFEVALAQEESVDVEVTSLLSDHEVAIPFNVTLEGASLYGSAHAWGALGPVGASSDAFRLIAPDGTEYASMDRDPMPGLGFSGGAFFAVEDASAGAWTLVYHASAPVPPGNLEVAGVMMAVVGETWLG